MSDVSAATAELLAAIAAVTGLAVQTPPAVHVAPESELAVLLEDTTGVPQHRIDHHERRTEALQLLGVLDHYPTGAELAPFVEGLFTPDPPTIRLHPAVAADEERMWAVLAHELVHAWQWEHRPELVAFVDHSSNRELARLAAIEGEAEWLGFRALMVQRGLTLPEAELRVGSVLGSWVPFADALDVDTVLPGLAALELFFPYVYGPPLAVDDWASPPQDSLQVLTRDPLAHRGGRVRRRRPARVRPVFTDELGPWLAASLATERGVPATLAATLVDAWQSDALTLWTGRDGRCASWDLRVEAAEQARQWAALLGGRAHGSQLQVHACEAAPR